MGERPAATTMASELGPDEIPCLVEFARECNRGGKYLEIGTAAGGTLCEMMGAMAREQRPAFVVVDPMNYFQNQMEIVRRNLVQHGIDPDTVDFRASASVEALPAALASGEQYDFMLIDGAHKIIPVAQDLRWLRLLRPGGVVCFHDYGLAHKGVKWNVDRLLRGHANYRLEKLVGCLAVVRKTAASRQPEGGAFHFLQAMLLSPWLQWERSFNKRRARRAAKRV